MRDATRIGTRWLGVGLAACLSVVTLALAATGRLNLYINPDSTWFTVGMAVVVLVGAVASFALPLGAEAHDDHDHDHDHDHDRRRAYRRDLGTGATIAGGIVATGVVGAMLILPPASLSAELAISRDVGAPPLFAGADAVALASTGDTASFGIGEWAAVFATATNPEAFDGDPITLTGFVTPGDGSGFDLTRLVITHCVIDAQPASIPITAAAAGADTSTGAAETGQWVTVTGRVRSTSDGRLEVQATGVEAIAEPGDPYEY